MQKVNIVMQMYRYLCVPTYLGWSAGGSTLVRPVNSFVQHLCNNTAKKSRNRAGFMAENVLPIKWQSCSTLVRLTLYIHYPRLNGVFFITQLTGGGGGLFFAPLLSDLHNYWSDIKISSGVRNFRKICWGKPSFLDLGLTDAVTGQVKDKMLSHFSDSMNDRFPGKNIHARSIS